MWNLCLITGSRAEFSLVLPLAQRLLKDPEINLSLLVTGSHLATGASSLKEIQELDWEQIFYFPIESLCRDLCLETAELLKSLHGFFRANGIDLCLGLGDRYEMMSVFLAAFYQEIPIAHIHGGDETQGALDNSLRHAMTKLSNLHFPATENSAKRILQMGEDPECVHTIGSPILDRIRENGSSLFKEVVPIPPLPFQKDFVLCTLHPETQEGVSPRVMLDALLPFLQSSGMKVLFTSPNSDPGGEILRSEILLFCSSDPERFQYVENLGSQLYPVAVRSCNYLIGNTSSGLLEAPLLGTPSINLGDRQKGREHGIGVFHANWELQSIMEAFKQLKESGFQANDLVEGSPYYKKESPAEVTILWLKDHLKRGISLRKHFEVVLK